MKYMKKMMLIPFIKNEYDESKNNDLKNSFDKEILDILNNQKANIYEKLDLYNKAVYKIKNTIKKIESHKDSDKIDIKNSLKESEIEKDSNKQLIYKNR